ncbi:MAG: hypothetical protein Tsb0021_00090 [Chlamydiales bacterium]
MVRFSTKTSLSQEKLDQLTDQLSNICEAVWYDADSIQGIVDLPHRETVLEILNINDEKLGNATKFSDFEERDWLMESQQSLPPVKIGNYLLLQDNAKIVSPHEKQICIYLDFFHSFGSGHHETTQMCIEAIELLSSRECKRALDFGCGSGILSIIISKQFEAEVFACDIDEKCIETTLKNAALNNIANIHVIKTDTLGTAALMNSYDLIVANIQADILLEQASHMIEAMAEHGILVLSGILNEQEDLVLSSFPLSLIKILRSSHWSTLILEK